MMAHFCACSTRSTMAFLTSPLSFVNTKGASLVYTAKRCRRYRSTWKRDGDEENRLRSSNEAIESGYSSDDNELDPCDYIFGYGSLMCSHSRALTAPKLSRVRAIPVVIANVEPVFAKRSKIGMTAMGIRHQINAFTFGVIIPVSRIDLPKFDDRERGYSRIALPLGDVAPVPFLGYPISEERIFLEAERNPEDDKRTQIWTYLPDLFSPADERYPIVQSYVDTILRGCLDVGGEEFAQKFIETTKGWNPNDLAEYRLDGHENEILRSSSIDEESFWIDDRDDPIYTRGDPVHSRDSAECFDNLLRTHIPQTFPRRRKRLPQ